MTFAGIFWSIVLCVIAFFSRNFIWRTFKFSGKIVLGVVVFFAFIMIATYLLTWMTFFT